MSESETTKALADFKEVIAGLPADAVKVKAFWQDYKFYLVAFVILVVGLIAGYHMHVCAVCK